MKYVRAALCLIFAGLATASVAAEPAISEFAGVYKLSRDNGIVNGTDKDGEPIIEKYTSEDILEIVPYGDDSFYFRKETQFFNAHSCSIYGIAKRTSANTYAFDDHGNEPEMRCQMQASISADKIEFKDVTPRDTSLKYQAGCHYYCGARGLVDDEWDRTRRREIRYTPRLKNSIQYRSAVESFEKSIPLSTAYDNQRAKGKASKP